MVLAAWESVVGIDQNAPPDHCANGFWYGQRGHVGRPVSDTVGDAGPRRRRHGGRRVREGWRPDGSDETSTVEMVACSSAMTIG